MRLHILIKCSSGPTLEALVYISRETYLCLNVKRFLSTTVDPLCFEYSLYIKELYSLNCTIKNAGVAQIAC